MDEVLLYIFIAIAIVTLWLVLHYWYKIQSREFIQSFIDSQATITILATEEKVTMMNQEGLNLLGFQSLHEFHKKHSNLVNVFMEVPGCENCLDKYTFGKKWISSIAKKQRKNNQLINKVKIHSEVDGLEHYFQIKASKIAGTKEYILNFTDITQIERNRVSLEKSAEIDSLTKVYNRAGLDKFFDLMLSDANKHGKMLSIILFDIDHFKKINDEYGHNIGDIVLVELARLVHNMLRKDHDFLVRWGGEEFLAVLPDTSAEDARKLAERVRKGVDEYYFKEVKHVTCSFGVTQFKNNDTRRLFIERADEALYEAKDNGRNKVVKKL